MASRREFLARVGEAGGFGAAFAVLQGLGLMPLRAQAPAPLALAPESGGGRHVIVLGAGIAGLVAAWELGRHGFRCTVLEARERPGGRNWTLRGGTRVVFDDGSTQVCGFSRGNYQNIGPARIASVHTAMLGYCRELGVPLEVEINTSRSTLLQNDAVNGGRPVTQRQAVNDTRGYVSELLAKCARGGALDQTLSRDDLDRLLTLLAAYGPLDRSGRYRGSDRSGYLRPPGAGDDRGTINAPLDLQLLLDSQFWRDTLQEESYDWQATMLQPVGGMDRIPHAFAQRLGPRVRYNAAVAEIRRTAGGARIVYGQGGSRHALEAGFCLCTLPLTMLRNVPNDFSPEVQAAIASARYSDAYKIAWEARRFWEQEYNIYGGLSYLHEGPSPVWYPSGGLFQERGVLVAGYAFGAAELAGLPLPQKLERSRRSVEKIHPGHGGELEHGIYVEWGRIPWSLGSWAANFGGGYAPLLQADGPFYFAGDHLSELNAWQEGAALSARRAVQMLGDRVRAGAARPACARPARGPQSPSPTGAQA